MGWEAVSILTFHQHRKCLPRSRSFLKGPIPVNGLHRFVKNHHVLGQGGHNAVCESLVAPEGNRGVPWSGPGLEARLCNKPSKLMPDQGAAGGSGPSSAREEGREEGVSREDYRSRVPQVFMESRPRAPLLGSSPSQRPPCAGQSWRVSGGPREGTATPTQSRPVCPTLRSKPPQCLQAGGLLNLGGARHYKMHFLLLITFS